MIGAFGIGTTEFVIMGLLPQMAKDLGVSLSSAGLLVSGYALGVAIGAPVLSLLSAKWPKKRALVILMAIFTVGNLICALAPNYTILMIARVLTSFAHGTFFGIGSVLATSLVKPNQKATAIALMFTGLTLANVLGVPFGTWLGQNYGWHATFWAVTAVGPLAMAALIFFVPATKETGDSAGMAKEISVVMKPQVLLSLLLTVFGFAGVFAVFTYIAPILTDVSGFEMASVSPILLLFGAGLVVGNIVGGKWADKHLNRTLVGTLMLLSLVLFGFTFLMGYKLAALVLVTLLGFAGFATVPPLQMRALEHAAEAPTLVSALNIAAFNLGNAIGAWAGGVAIDNGNLITTAWTALGVSLLATLVAYVSGKANAGVVVKVDRSLLGH
ncbi:sugar efflux transporter [Bdellovibrio bacteriovorus str. Tiberius]|uniref:Sugar efflux transporter n=2 Tax=Bdellovibrio bacteriovorus TaxID=959 RepID=K7YTE3_BDEBC|nr:sugar efflux transporter [Bdellovibrio bacteriovorus str. Tiberius]